MEIEDLLQLFDSWRHDQLELKQCYADCEVSAGYHCYHQAENEKESREKFGKALNAYIDQRIKAYLEAK